MDEFHLDDPPVKTSNSELVMFSLQYHLMESLQKSIIKLITGTIF